MNKTFALKTSLVAAAMLALPMAHAAGMGKAEFNAAKTRIEADYKADRAACDSLAGNGKDVCVEQAKGKEKVARAELDASYSGKPDDRNKVMVVKAETAYAVAKEKCDDKAGNDKDVCVKEAKAVETKALADAKMSKETGAAAREATADKRDADLKVALEKCDALSGDAKASCVADAKAKFGKG